VVVGNSDARPIAGFLHHGTGRDDDLRPSTASSFLWPQTLGAAEIRNARPALRQYLGRRSIDSVWVSSGCDRCKRLELGPGVHANPFRLESRHRNHLVQLAVLYGVSERIRQLCDQRSGRRAGSRKAPANSLASYGHPHPFSLLDRHTISSPYSSSSLLPETFSTARKASCGMSTWPTRFMRFLPSFCFSRSLRLREMSPP